MRYRGLLLDFDGTLVDSAAAIRGGLRAALNALALPVPSEAELTACIGLPLPHVWRRLGVGDGQVAAAEAGYRAWSSAGGQDLARPFPGIPELLRDLHAAGVALVLATAKDTASAGRHLDRHGWRHLFAGFSGAEPGDAADKRAIVARGLRLMPIAAHDRTAMVGDMAVDGDAAAAAGIPFIAVGWGGGHPDELARQRPVARPTTVQELAGWLAGT